MRANGRASSSTSTRRSSVASRTAEVGACTVDPKRFFDFVHAADDNHGRLAYAEIHPDERSETCASFLRRADDYFAGYGITRIEQVITDKALAYRRAHAFPAAVAELGAQQLFIEPHCPWQNGKGERFNRTLATERAYLQPFASNSAPRF